jgi:hypothetical protein
MNKYRLKIITVVINSFLISNLFAAEINNKNKCIPLDTNHKNINITHKDSFSTSIVNMYMDYKEYDDYNDILDSEKGNLFIGVETNYYQDYIDKSFFNITHFVGVGITDYTGSYLNNNEHIYGSVKSTTVNFIIDDSLSYGFNLDINKYFDIKIGGTLGGHLWGRMLSENQKEYYYWFYIEPIIGLKYKYNDKLNIGLNLKFPLNFYTKMYADNIDSNFTLGGVKTIGFSIPVYFKINKLNYLFEFEYEDQEITKSNIIDGYYEPRSKSTQMYFKLGMKF